MQALRPGWGRGMRGRRFVMAGACGLAFGAAFANTGLVLHTGTSVSHLTGDIARLTVDVATWSPERVADALRVGLAAVSFLAGAFASGFMIHHPTVDFSRPYGRSLAGIGALFVVAFLLVDRHPAVSTALGAMACGFQNALASHYRGIVLRTTHLTGMFTDLGVTLGMRLRGHAIPSWKVRVPLFIIGSFVIGGFLAAVLHLRGINPIGAAGAAYCGAGVAWSIAKRRKGSSAIGE